MRLLYYYGRMQKFDSETNDYVAINFSREYEFELKDDDFFKDDNKNVLSVTIKRSYKSLPHDFWSKDGKVYNCTVFVGENGAGKSTVLQNIMRSILDIDIKTGNERLVILQDHGEIFAVARKKTNKTIIQDGNELISRNEQLYYSLEKTISFDENGEANISLYKLEEKSNPYFKKFPYPNVDKNKDISTDFNKARIVYFSNTFSENDLLDNLYKQFGESKEVTNRLNTCLRNYSIVQRLKDVLAIENYDPEKQFRLYWSDRYKEQAEFVFSKKAISEINSLNEDGLKTAIPKALTISGIDSVVASSAMKELKDKLFGLVVKRNEACEYVPYILSIYSLLQIVNNLKYKQEKATNKIEGIIEEYKNKVSTIDHQKALLESIKNSVIDTIIEEKGLSKEYISELKAASNNKDGFLLRHIVVKEEENLLNALINSYEFCNFLYVSKMITKLTPNFPKLGSEPNFNKGQYEFDNWKIYANTSELRQYGDQFSILIDKYNDTLIETEGYLDFSWGLSSGEENVLAMLSCLYKLSREYTKNENDVFSEERCNDTLLIFYDEADIGYHPEWQRKWFSVFPQMVEVLFSDINDIDIQFIVATHSPLLLGDVPSNCAKYVERTEQRKIIIKEKLFDEDGEFVTFGENLYTILRNGFFLKEGTIGEIAINKSESISKAFGLFRELIKKPNSKDADCQLIIEQIEEKNDEAIKIFKKDFIEIDRKYKNEKIIVSESSERVSVKCGAYLYYIDSLINQYSGFIKERLMKELDEIIQFVM